MKTATNNQEINKLPLSKNTIKSLKTKTNTKAGGRLTQHNQKLRIKTNVKAGGIQMQHNQSTKVKTKVKAGGIQMQHNQNLQ